MSNDFDDDDDENFEAEEYELGSSDLIVVKAAIQLLEKIIRAPFVSPAEIVSISKALHVLKRLPNTSSEMNVSITLTGPCRWFHGQGEEHKIYHWWEVEIEGMLITITSRGYFYRDSTNGDSFIAMDWKAAPGCETDHAVFLDQLGLVDDAQPFEHEVTQIDLSKPGYKLTVNDDDNPLLEEIAEDEEIDVSENSLEEDEDEGDSRVDEEPDAEDELEVTGTNPELTANLWAFEYSTTGLIYMLAGRAYWLSGDDDKKLATLSELARHDFRCAHRVPVPDRFALQYTDGTTKSGFATPQAVGDPDSLLFEEVIRKMENELPPINDFLSGQTKQQKFSNEPLCVRTIVFEDKAGNCRAIITDEDRQWLAEQLDN